MTRFELPIVGLWFRPPASALLRLVPLNTTLCVRIDPNNSVDSNAIAVDLRWSVLELDRKPTLRKEIAEIFSGWNTGHPDKPAEFDLEAAFHLGFIPAVDALAIRTKFPNFESTEGTLGFGPKAKPFVRFSI